ncbi:MAG: pitrilysin family protein [Woeseia sp.]
MKFRAVLQSLGCAAVSVVFATSVYAAEVDIEFTEYTLDNGLRLIVHEDPKAPIVAVNIWYHVGSRNEQAGKTGFAHLFEHLMFNGSENFNEEMSKPLERAGATGMNGTTSFDRTNYFETVPKTALDMALWLESDRMGHLLGVVDEEKLTQERGVVQNEKRQSENEPYGQAFNHILKNVFPPQHPYSWSTIGSMEDLEAASLDDVHEWFKTYYGPNNAVIVIAGDIRAEEAREKVEYYFGDIPPGPPIAQYDSWTVKLDGDKREVLQDRVPQARLYKVWGAPHYVAEDTELLQLANGVLAGGKNSRLFERLVYTDQTATDVSASLLPAEIAGLYLLQATAQPGASLDGVEQAVNEELRRFLEDGPTADELERVRTEIVAGFIRGVERIGGFGGKSDVLAENAVYTGDPGFFRTSLERLEQATPASVQAAANRWLTAGAYHLEIHPYPELQASTEGADRSALPQPASFPEVNFDEFERSRLANGMELVVATRRAVPVVNLSLRLDAGYAADQFGAPGTATLTMAMLDEGTRSRSALEISDELARLGAELGAGAGLDTSVVYLSALKENLDESLAIYADVVLNPSFPEHELERLRKSMLAKIAQEKTQPVGIALRVLPALMYGEGHAYSLPLTGSGTEESVARITRDSLVDHHRTWFRPGNAVVIVVGDTTMEEIRPKLEKAFARWRPGSVPGKNIADVAEPEREQVFIVDRPGSEQSIILVGNVAPPVGDENEIAIEAMNEILGGDAQSRIYSNLRKDKHWSYGAYSFLLPAKGPRPFIAYAPVQTDKTKESMAELKRELTELLGENPPAENELQRVIASSTLSLPGRWETASAVLGDIAEIVTYDLPDDYWDTYPDRVRSLSVEELAEAAGAVVKPDRLLWVVVGDREKIEPRIRELEIGGITLLDADGNVIPPAAGN